MKHAFQDRVVWITGASAGIGAACARLLAEQGARLALSGRRADRLDVLADELRARGADALPVVCDVTDEAAQADAVERVVGHFGALDVAFANAGFSVSGRIEELDADDWRRQLDTNVVGAALTARYALPHLRRTSGRLALTGSVAAYLPAPGFGAYHCSKYALRALGATLSAELHGSGVSCTTVHPGMVESEINQVDNLGRFDPSKRDRRPARFIWRTDDAARVILRAIAKRKREVVFTNHGKVGAFIGQHFPDLAHFIMSRGDMRRRADRLRSEARA